MGARVAYSVPILRVKDVERSVRFYERLGFECTAMLRTTPLKPEEGLNGPPDTSPLKPEEGLNGPPEGTPYWANLSCFRGNPEERTTENESAAVMVSLGEDPHSPMDGSMQAASLYLFTKDLVGLRAQLVSEGVEVTEIVSREYMPKGEMELRDPDGWKVFVGGV